MSELGGPEPPSSEYSVIYATADGGRNWAQTDKVVGGGECVDVRFVGGSGSGSGSGSGEAWAACDTALDMGHFTAHMKHTTDYGMTWVDHPILGGSPAIPMAIDMAQGNDPWQRPVAMAQGPAITALVHGRWPQRHAQERSTVIAMR